MEYVRIRVAEPPAENVSRYYEIMQERFERGIITQHLQFRAEAGSTRRLQPVPAVGLPGHLAAVKPVQRCCVRRLVCIFQTMVRKAFVR